MFFLENPRVIMYDVDDTLVLHHKEDDERALEFTHPSGTKLLLVPHVKHINALKSQKDAGWAIVVWSQGGSDWAKAVLEGLDLTKYVDAIITKPQFYYDDLTSPEFMGRPMYVHYE
jgi:phosphoglycolate phosphatase-like HAD superfamily hydrolase